MDERIHHISRRAGYRAFQVVFVLLGALTVALGLSGSRLEAYPVVGATFTLTAAVYLGGYLWIRGRT